MLNVFERRSTNELEVGKWFRIDREIINRNRKVIRRKCNEAGDEGKAYWRRFEKANKIADENPDKYPRLIETYIFEYSWKYKLEQEMRDMCKEVGAEMCDEVICNLELQMRICNGESVVDLFKKADRLPRVRIIKLRDGGTGYFGGGTDDSNCHSPANISSHNFSPNFKHYFHTPYAFRLVLLQH